MEERCLDCRPSIELEQLKEKVKRIEEINERRLNDHADRIKKLESDGVGTARDISSFKESLARIEKSIEKIASSLENLKSKPAQRWEDAVKTVIAILITGAVTYFISKK